LDALLWLCANNPVYNSIVIDYSVLDAWPDHHIPQEIRDAFITLGSEPGSMVALVEEKREGYAASLQGGLFVVFGARIGWPSSSYYSRIQEGIDGYIHSLDQGLAILTNSISFQSIWWVVYTGLLCNVNRLVAI
jgi:hypothetical protein